MIDKNYHNTTIHIVCGPTASGKSTYAMTLAAQNNGVIINCDSLQIYDGLPILTAQPTIEDKNSIPHELYGKLHPNEPCSAGNWREMAILTIKKTLSNNQTPIICGGSGLYIKALIDGLSPMPDITDETRQKVEEMYKESGAQGLHEELAKQDPVMAARLHPNHSARLMRAMEMIIQTGTSLAEWQEKPREKPPEDWKFEVHKIMPPREELYNNCNTRFEKMLNAGALEEVEKFTEKLENSLIKQGAPLTKALGYEHLRDYIKGLISREEAIEKSQTQTRHYAKKQVTWFRHQI